MIRSFMIYSLLLLFISLALMAIIYRTYFTRINKGHHINFVKERSTKDIEHEQSTGKQRIEKICKKFGYKPENVVGTKEKFVIDVRHNLLACMNPKVGSSSWKRHFYYLLTIKEKKRLESKFGAECWMSGCVSF